MNIQTSDLLQQFANEFENNEKVDPLNETCKIQFGDRVGTEIYSPDPNGTKSPSFEKDNSGKKNEKSSKINEKYEKLWQEVEKEHQ